MSLFLHFRGMQTGGCVEAAPSPRCRLFSSATMAQMRWRCLSPWYGTAAEVAAATGAVMCRDAWRFPPLCVMECQAAMVLGWPNRNRWPSPPPSLLLRCCCEVPLLLCGWLPAAADGPPLSCRCQLHTPTLVPVSGLTACALGGTWNAHDLVCTCNQSTECVCALCEHG